MTLAPLSPMAALPLPKDYPSDSKQRLAVETHRSAIKQCLTGESPKRLLVLGPCSIDSIDSALTYGERLKQLQTRVSDSLLLVMRTYVEKPRTTTGWPGFIHDPQHDGSHSLARGIEQTRKLLTSLGSMDVPCAAELLNPMLAPYYTDLLSYASIGARTSESQIHRQLASQLAMPVGIKNPTSGDLTVAAHGVYAATQSQATVTLNAEGHLIPAHSQGNPHAHLILRGSRSRPNYSPQDLSQAMQALQAYNCPLRLVIDCSHGNSQRCHEKQADVARDIITHSLHAPQLAGLMLESYLIGGRQDPASPRQAGQSLTDACLSWETTEALVLEMARALAKQQRQDKVIYIPAT